MPTKAGGAAAMAASAVADAIAAVSADLPRAAWAAAVAAYATAAAATAAAAHGDAGAAPAAPALGSDVEDLRAEMGEFRRWMEEDTAGRCRRDVEGRRRHSEEAAQASQVAEEVRQQRATLAELQRRGEQATADRGAQNAQIAKLWRAMAAAQRHAADAAGSPRGAELAPLATRAALPPPLPPRGPPQTGPEGSRRRAGWRQPPRRRRLPHWRRRWRPCGAAKAPGATPGLTKHRWPRSPHGAAPRARAAPALPPVQAAAARPGRHTCATNG